MFMQPKHMIVCALCDQTLVLFQCHQLIYLHDGLMSATNQP